MWNETNPTNLYLGTTWKLLVAGRYIQSGNTPLSTGGSNSISITKANLPNIKLKVDSFSLTTQPHTHSYTDWRSSGVYRDGQYYSAARFHDASTNTSSAGGQNTGTASPSTEVLGSGTALSIQPAYITLKFWKRLT